MGARCLLVFKRGVLRRGARPAPRRPERGHRAYIARCEAAEAPEHRLFAELVKSRRRSSSLGRRDAHP